jgi:hypothetical protein
VGQDEVGWRSRSLGEEMRALHALSFIRRVQKGVVMMMSRHGGFACLWSRRGVQVHSTS